MAKLLAEADPDQKSQEHMSAHFSRVAEQMASEKKQKASEGSQWVPTAYVYSSLLHAQLEEDRIEMQRNEKKRREEKLAQARFKQYNPSSTTCTHFQVLVRVDDFTYFFHRPNQRFKRYRKKLTNRADPWKKSVLGLTNFSRFASMSQPKQMGRWELRWELVRRRERRLIERKSRRLKTNTLPLSSVWGNSIKRSRRKTSCTKALCQIYRLLLVIVLFTLYQVRVGNMVDKLQIAWLTVLLETIIWNDHPLD